MTARAVYADIPVASNAGRVVRALQAARQVRISDLAPAIGAPQAEAMAAVRQLTARGIVQIRSAFDEQVAVLTAPPEELEPEIVGAADGRNPGVPGVKERVYDYLSLRPGRWRLTSAIANALDIPERRVRQRLRELEIAGVVERRKKHNETGHLEIEWKVTEAAE